MHYASDESEREWMGAIKELSGCAVKEKLCCNEWDIRSGVAPVFARRNVTLPAASAAGTHE